MVWGLLYFSVPIFSQQLSNVRKKTILLSGDSTKIDSLSIVPGSVLIKSVGQPDFTIDFQQSLIIWKRKPTTPSIEIEYRVFPFSNQRAYRRLSYDSIFYRFGTTPQKFPLINSITSLLILGKFQLQAAWAARYPLAIGRMLF